MTADEAKRVAAYQALANQIAAIRQTIPAPTAPQAPEYEPGLRTLDAMRNAQASQLARQQASLKAQQNALAGRREALSVAETDPDAFARNAEYNYANRHYGQARGLDAANTPSYMRELLKQRAIAMAPPAAEDPNADPPAEVARKAALAAQMASGHYVSPRRAADSSENARLASPQFQAMVARRRALGQQAADAATVRNVGLAARRGVLNPSAEAYYAGRDVGGQEALPDLQRRQALNAAILAQAANGSGTSAVNPKDEAMAKLLLHPVMGPLIATQTQIPDDLIHGLAASAANPVSGPVAPAPGLPPSIPTTWREIAPEGMESRYGTPIVAKATKAGRMGTRAAKAARNRAAAADEPAAEPGFGSMWW